MASVQDLSPCYVIAAKPNPSAPDGKDWWDLNIGVITEGGPKDEQNRTQGDLIREAALDFVRTEVEMPENWFYLDNHQIGTQFGPPHHTIYPRSTHMVWPDNPNPNAPEDV